MNNEEIAEVVINHLARFGQLKNPQFKDELKNRHGLGLARYLGLIKMRIQTYLSAICVNIKRMIRLIFCNASPPKIRLRRASS